jgi:exodeoxyribonuclease V beta subunit
MSTAIALNPVTFPLFGTRLIEASAGTGKTYTIAALYVRLILGHQSDDALPRRELLPPEILVVTFTEASTKELRERIRERLSQVARFFREQPVKTDPFLEAIRADYDPALWSACARRLELAANWMDEAAVYTIHSWCNRMLQQHAFDSGSLFHQEVNTDDTELLNEVVRDYWRTFYYEMAHDDSDFLVLYSLFQQPDNLLGEIRSLLNNADPISNCLTPDQDIKTLMTAVNTAKKEVLQSLKQPWGVWADEIKELVETAVKNKVLPGKNYKSNYIQNWIDKLITWSLDPNQDALDLGTGFKSLSPAGMENLANAGQTPPVHPGFEAISHVALVLPENRSPVITRELIYTGITRAKENFTLLESSGDVFNQAVLASCI